MASIYGEYGPALRKVMNRLTSELESFNLAHTREHGESLYDHLSGRIKDEESMREKLRRRGLEESTRCALRDIQDAVGIRVVCRFIDDVYETVRLIRGIPGCTVVLEKDYIRNAKENGYRSYHIILEAETDEPDPEGRTPGRFFAEIQLRTIAMDTWAALEHELKYKKDLGNMALVGQELRRCANELAACDVSMQTLRRIIRGPEAPGKVNAV